MIGFVNRSLVNIIVILSAAGVALVLFIFLTPPLFNQPVFPVSAVLGGLEGDLPVYLSRFFLSFALLGLLPFLCLLVLGEKPRNNGLAWPRPGIPRLLYPLFLLAGVAIGLMGAYAPDLFAYYPYSRTIVTLIGERGAGYLFLHAALYFFLYYVPWEFFFRGFLIFPFLKLIRREEQSAGPGQSVPERQRTAALIALIVSFQVLPSAMLHVGHPLSELLSAVPAGFFFGYLVFRTRSILPPLFVHAAIGIATDTFIILRLQGVLP